MITYKLIEFGGARRLFTATLLLSTFNFDGKNEVIIRETIRRAVLTADGEIR